MKITVSVIKADVGGIGGHTKPSDGLIKAIRDTVENSGDLLIDHYIGYCGDDTHIVMTHKHGVDNEKIHKLAWDAFMAGTQVARNEGAVWRRSRFAKRFFLRKCKRNGSRCCRIRV